MVAPSQGVHVVVDRSFRHPRTLCWCPRPPMAASCSPCPGWASDPGDHRHAAAGPGARTPAVCRGARFHPARVGPLPGAGAACGRRVELLRACVRWYARRRTMSATSSWSREHTVQASCSGLVTVTGGKWTTYRAMAEDVLTRCQTDGLLTAQAPCRTQRLQLWGADDLLPQDRHSMAAPQGPHSYGSDWPAVAALPAPTARWATGSPRRWCALPRAMSTRARSRTCWPGGCACCS